MMLFNDTLRKLGLKYFQSHVMSVTMKKTIRDWQSAAESEESRAA